jgi:hypothetical protein
MAAVEPMDIERRKRPWLDANQLIARVIDKVDKILYQNDLEFAEEDRWHDATEDLRRWIFEYYEEVSHSSDTYINESSTSESIEVDDEEESDEEEEEGRDIAL